MPVSDTIRESFVGQLVYSLSGRRYFRYAEDDPDYVLPDRYAKLLDRRSNVTTDSATGPSSETGTLADTDGLNKTNRNSTVSEKPRNGVQVTEKRNSNDTTDAVTDTDRQSLQNGGARVEIIGISDQEKGIYAEVQQRKVEEEQHNPFIVDWYSPTDQENPRNVRESSDLSSSLMLTHAPSYSVEFGQTVLRHIRHLPPHIQYLHRLRHLRAGHPRHHSTIWHLARRGLTRHYDVCRGVRHRAHVPLTAL